AGPERRARHHAQPAHGDRRRRRPAREGVHRKRVDAGSADCGPEEDSGLRKRRRLRSSASPVHSVSSVSSVLSARERRLIARLRTPAQVQLFLNRLPYNEEPHGRATLRSSRGVVRHGSAHCLEAALFAATVLDAHGYPPLVLSFESIDDLDHVIFVYKRRGRWGSVARSRDPGLHGRKPVFATPRALALSYFDPYIDLSGRLTGYAVLNLDDVMGDYDWRLSGTNVWKVERVLLDYRHRRISSSNDRVNRLRARYRRFVRTYPGHKPLPYPGR